jgi:hypothetical protein
MVLPKNQKCKKAGPQGDGVALSFQAGYEQAINHGAQGWHLADMLNALTNARF